MRAVATSAVRDASNQLEFLQTATDTLGSHIELISGREEARLIHRGVTSQSGRIYKRALVIDIGGGSAELITSEEGHFVDAVSRPLGAVRLKQMFLGEDPPSPRALRQLEDFVDEKIDSAVRRMGGKWDRVIASSATAAAVVCAVNGIVRAERDQASGMSATIAQVRSLYKQLAQLDAAGRRKIPGIGPRRAEIITAGTGTLLRIMERFHASSVYYSSAGVREGIVTDLSDTGGDEPARLNSDQRREVERAATRFGVGLRRARHMAEFANSLFMALQPLHRLTPPFGRVLEAACYFCDAGHYISDSAHHKHAYYIVSNLDFSGFAERERYLIAALCRYHRKALPRESHVEFAKLSPDDKAALSWLIPVFRLADNLDLSPGQQIELTGCDVDDRRVNVRLRAAHELDLTEWAAARVSELFSQRYGRTVAVHREDALDSAG